MLVKLNTIASKQSKVTQEKAKKVVKLFNYAATHPEAVIWYHTSKMTLHMHSDTSFITAPWGNRREGGYHYLSEPSTNTNNPLHKTPPLNGPMHLECTIIKNVLAIAMEAKLGELFVNFQQEDALIIPLKEMGHQQPLTPVATYSSNSDKFVNDNIWQQKSKAIDMRFYWVHGRVR